MAHITLSIPLGYPRVDQPLHLDRSALDEIEFDANECSFYEALEDAGYGRLASANWIQESANEYRLLVDGELIYVAEVTQ